MTKRILSLALLGTFAVACGGGDGESGSTSGSGGASTQAGAGGSAGTGGSSGSAAGGAGATSTTTSSSGASSGAGGGAPCQDMCPAPNGGVTIACEKRFVYGVNYAWADFGGDFGGITAYGGGGVASDKAKRLAELQDMHAAGADVIRWWVFPDLRGDGIKLDNGGTPTGLGGTITADVAAALDLAAQADVHLQLTLFSFDAFKPDPVHNKNIASIVTSAAKQAALVDNVVKPLAAAVKSSPNKDRLHSWDVINEPEWATTGNDGVDEDFTPQGAPLTPISYAQMKGFIGAVITALHASSDRPVTVGGAAIKWANAWEGAGIDFYTFHMYDWVNMYYPYTTPLANYGVTNKPVVLGEFPLNGLTGVTYAQLVTKLFDLGYAGAMGWAVTDPNFGPWDTVKGNVKAFATQKGCVVKY